MPPPTPGPPLNQPLDLILHIGSGKTGTSSIQFFLHHNRERLAELGCFYPQSPGRRRHTQVSLFAQPDKLLGNRHSWGRQNTDSPKEFRRTFRRRLFGEINRSGLSRVLLSDEALFGSPDAALERLRRFTDRVARSLRLVAYLRRQDDHLVSRYQQAVKTGETKRLVERDVQLTLSRTYDYHARIRLWQRLLEPTEFVVRRFERDRFAEGSLYQDFLDAAGIRVKVGELEPVGSLNESLDAEAVEFLRIVNILRKENPGVAASLPAYNRPLFRRLSAASTGPTLTMPEPVLDEFMAQWEESNRRVAVEVFGDESGELFRTPRKTRNTTTEQHLDPARIDHFGDVLELPQRMYAPLRELAEREAKVR